MSRWCGNRRVRRRCGEEEEIEGTGGKIVDGLRDRGKIGQLKNKDGDQWGIKDMVEKTYLEIGFG